MAYVKMDKDLVDDWRVLALADALFEEWIAGALFRPEGLHFRGAACNAVIGALYRLWRYADTHLRHDDRLNLALPVLADVTQLSVTVLQKFPPEWLRQNADGTVSLPGYSLKNVLIDKDHRRELSRERQRRFRQRMRDGQNDRRRRERNDRDRYSGATTGTGTGPGTGPVPPYRDRDRPEPESQDAGASRGELASAGGRLARRETPREQIEENRRAAARIAARFEVKP